MTAPSDRCASSRPRLLDLFCGAGGCAVGYHRAGFDVTGVDIVKQPNYPFMFVQADALEYAAEHAQEFDAASVVGVHGNLNYSGERALREEAMGVDWMTPYELTQAIPPAYCEHIGAYLLAAVDARGVAA